jgi:pyrroloquinoline quinone (PQQ) biosynthesis protein C
MATAVMPAQKTAMSAKEADAVIASLTKKVNERWAAVVETTPFMNELVAGKLPKKTIQEFYRNWASFVPTINSCYTVQFYKHLWFFVSNLDLMKPYTEKVLDEFGHPEPPGHIHILLSTGHALGLTSEEMLARPMLATARGLTDFHRTLVNDGLIQEYWCSVLWERSFGETCLKWFNALTQHYGLTAEQADYFNKHHEADTMDHLGREEHSAVSRKALSRLLQIGVIERPGYTLEYCATTPADLYADMLNATYKATH